MSAGQSTAYPYRILYPLLSKHARQAHASAGSGPWWRLTRVRPQYVDSIHYLRDFQASRQSGCLANVAVRGWVTVQRAQGRSRTRSSDRTRRMRRTRPHGATQETLIEAIATSVPTITGQKASEIEHANDATALAEIAGTWVSRNYSRPDRRELIVDSVTTADRHLMLGEAELLAMVALYTLYVVARNQDRASTQRYISPILDHQVSANVRASAGPAQHHEKEHARVARFCRRDQERPVDGLAF